MANSPRKIHFVSLGCPKNRVDSEVMLGVAERAGYQQVTEADEAEVIVVNTCGFIDSAKQESIDTILELSRHKESGQCRKLVVTGCLSQKYSGDLAADLPEVDHFLGSSDMLKLGPVLSDKGADRMLVGNPADWVISATDPRRVSTRGRSAYVKIAEGCNRSCSFCIIPQLRGKQRSRATDDVVREVEALAAAGVLEINLVSQDTIAYGRDLDLGDGALASLVRRVADVPGIRWVRLFYLYPEKLTEDVIELIAGHPNVVPYIDMPLQHASDPILRSMRRGHGGDRLRKLVERVRTHIPQVTFRTAFIVGHPGETDADFKELCDFVSWAQFDRMGVFVFSDEPTSHSFTLQSKVPQELAQERASQLMELQRPISQALNRKAIGRSLEVLVEGPSEEEELVMIGRHAGQAPDIDGCVYLSGATVTGAPALPGQLLRGTVTDATDYDLLLEIDSEIVAGFAPDAAQGSVGMRPSDGRRVGLPVVRG
ncbi:MAG TPA: 30S ribosomal protein S12 methylthiotransferase RimO [Polyangiaceae bacterium]|jgi:ribosomal protein S12 methylthiotransferase|nr:30S ribosomal protein S12 methylthiotransferase RimO [Polyangiaceae bacterium]